MCEAVSHVVWGPFDNLAIFQIFTKTLTINALKALPTDADNSDMFLH